MSVGALIAATAALLLSGEAANGSALNALTTAGREVSGTSVDVRCATPAEDSRLRDDYARAETVGQKIVLSRTVCALIATSTVKRAFGVEVFAHELGHATLHTKTECLAQRYGVAHWRELWRLLIPVAPSVAQVRYLAMQEWIYPWKNCTRQVATFPGTPA